MKKHKTLFFKSVTKKKLFWVYLLTSIPLFLCILIGSEYGKRLLLQQSIHYNHNTLSLQLATVDTSLDHISNYLASFLLDSQNYHTLAHGESDPQEELAILDSFTDYLDTYNSSASLFFYIPDQDILIFQSANYDSYNDRQEMRRYIRQACRKKTFPATSPQIRGWSFLRIGQKSYLMELMEYQNVYVGAFGAGEYIFSDFKDLTASTHGVFILSNQDAVEDLLFGAPEINRAHCVEIPVDSAKKSLPNHPVYPDGFRTWCIFLVSVCDPDPRCCHTPVCHDHADRHLETDDLSGSSDHHCHGSRRTGRF